MISDESLKAFVDAYARVTGERLGSAEALEAANRLLALLKLLARVNPQSQTPCAATASSDHKPIEKG